MTPSVSIVVLTHNKLPYTRRCISSLLDTDFKSWELVIVDNGSTDGTREWLTSFVSDAASRGIEVKLLWNESNIGCSTSRNQGWSLAGGRYVVFMDNDVALRSRNWLTALSSRLADDSNNGLVGPKLVYPFPPYAIQCAGAAVSASGRIQFRGRGEPKETADFNRPCEVQCLISACFMTRRDILLQTGGFDEAFNPVEYEDIDLSYNIRSLGYNILYEPSVEMYHFESVTTAGTAALPNTYLIIKNGMLFKKRWRHMFENELGPTDAETKWRDIQTKTLESVGPLPLT